MTSTSGEVKTSCVPDRRWKCSGCNELWDDNVILFQCGCQKCGSMNLEIVRLEQQTSSGQKMSGGSNKSSHELLRTPSTEVSALVNVPRRLARQALQFAGGDVNAACRNLLLCTLDPSGAPPFVVLAKSELASIGGISQEMALELLNKYDNDVERCKQELMKGIFEEEILWDNEGREVVKPRVQKNEEAVECAICCDDASPGQAIILGQCSHTFCIKCLKSHINTCMNSGTTLIGCPAQCGAEISQAELREVVGMDYFQKIDRRALERVVELDPSLHFCPTADCSNIVCWTGEEDGLPICNCNLCNRSSCLVCGVSPYHKKITCDQHRQLNTAESDADRAANEKAFQEYVARSNIRVCPRCKNAVVKSSGCNKMKCRCGYRFCYVCLVENALCGHTPSSHGFIDNLSGRGDFSNLKDKRSPT